MAKGGNMERPKCPICDHELEFRWTDTHGVGACLTCNAPVKIYHYEGEVGSKRRVEKPPEFIVAEEWVPLVRKHWAETHSRVPNGLNIPGSRYEPCTDAEFERWNGWLDEHRDEIPKEDADAEEAQEVSG